MNEPRKSWAATWLDAVADGSKTMSQRKLSWVERQVGGLAAVRREAEARGIHLVVLTDDKGDELVAASNHPFKVIC